MRSKSLATALIVLILGGMTGSWHVERDDPDFAPPASTHDHSSHHDAFNRPSSTPDNGHCAICHWLQMFRASALRHARVQLDTSSPDTRVVTVIPPVRAAALLALSPRAPPA
jgi:hypothetical protein